MELRTHDVTLRAGRLTLRPLTDDDWEILYRWNSDPEVLNFTEGKGTEPYGSRTVRQIYTTVSQTAHCFIIELDGSPIGECWLQQMNLERYQEHGHDVRRIDIMIGEKQLWGRGYGTAAIARLVEFAFDIERADALYACGVASYNRRSLGAFRRVGFQVCAERPREGSQDVEFDLRLDRPE